MPVVRPSRDRSTPAHHPSASVRAVEPFTSADGSRSLLSQRYAEPYRSRHGARSESWHVFVAGSGVAARLAAGQPTTVLELGLGTARNLGASAAVALAFGTPLRYVACEHDLLPADAWASQEPDALGPPRFRDALLTARRAWEALPGRSHTLRVGPVQFELLLGDAREATWPTTVDAVYLDAFSPAVNPELWTEAVLQRVAASLAAGGSVVSYCVQGRVRRRLVAAGLEVERRPGPPGGKREVLWAQRPRQSARLPRHDAPRQLTGQRAALVGGGVAGCSLALAAARAGASVEVFDAGTGVFDAGAGAHRASAVPAALVNPYRGRAGRATLDDRLGAARTWSWAAALAAEGLASGAHPCGVVRVADGTRQARSWRERPGTIGFEPDVEPGSGRWRAPYGGIVVPSGGWIDPPRWLATLRRAAEARGARWHDDARVEALERRGDGRWQLRARAAADAAAGPFDLVALCLGANPPGALPHLPVTAQPGSVVLMPGHLPARPLAGAVYAATVGSPERYGLDPRRAYLAIGGGDPDHADDGTGLLAAVAWTLPREPGPLQGSWRGLRARGPDPAPQVEALAPGVWWFGSFAGRGFLRAALEAERLVVRWSLVRWSRGPR